MTAAGKFRGQVLLVSLVLLVGPACVPEYTGYSLLTALDSKRYAIQPLPVGYLRVGFDESEGYNVVSPTKYDHPALDTTLVDYEVSRVTNGYYLTWQVNENYDLGLAYQAWSHENHHLQDTTDASSAPSFDVSTVNRGVELSSLLQHGVWRSRMRIASLIQLRRVWSRHRSVWDGEPWQVRGNYTGLTYSLLFQPERDGTAWFSGSLGPVLHVGWLTLNQEDVAPWRFRYGYRFMASLETQGLRVGFEHVRFLPLTAVEDVFWSVSLSYAFSLQAEGAG
jgi:hypothetical protein